MQKQDKGTGLHQSNSLTWEEDDAKQLLCKSQPRQPKVPKEEGKEEQTLWECELPRDYSVAVGKAEDITDQN